MARPSAECPRCGYNLDGTVSTWTKQCPIRGQCNECGLEFDWHRVFVLTVHPWLFEYHWRRKPFSRFLQTVLYAFRPRRFWREVRLTDPVHLKPATFVAGLLVLVTVALLVTATILGDYQRLTRWGFSEEWSFWLTEALEAAVRIPLVVVRKMPGLPAALFAMPILFSLLPTTLRQARVRSSHILRIFAYSLIAPIAIGCLWSTLYLALSAIASRNFAEIVSPFRWRGHADPSVLITLIHESLPGMALVIPCTIWMAHWWYLACKQYLQLKQARSVTAVLTFVLILFATVLELVFP